MEQAEDIPSVRLVSVNQIVAWNIAWLRREATLRQEDLADRLGWPKNKVSEAERSWNGKRTREFDAHTLVSLAVALGVPVNAFFVPPLDDGQEVTYVIRPEGQDEDWGMEDLMGLAMPDTDEDTAVMASYRRRLVAAVGRYLGPEWEKEVARWLRRTFGRNALTEGALHLRALAASMLTDAARIGGFADALEEAAGEEDE
jgi:transcriptional regulator with XRE-family HTH domain